MTLVDVSDFIFLCSGEGPGRGGSDFIENPKRGAWFSQERGGGRRARWVSVGDWGGGG